MTWRAITSTPPNAFSAEPRLNLELISCPALALGALDDGDDGRSIGGFESVAAGAYTRSHFSST
jgi:hypothetical protein